MKNKIPDSLDVVDLVNIADDLGTVVRSAIFIEKRIEEFLKAVLGISAKGLDDLDLRLSQKIELAFATGLISTELRPALKTFCKLRNDFAHRLGTSVTDHEIKNLIAGLPEVVRETLRLSHEAENEDTAKWEDVEPGLALGYIVIGIYSYIESSQNLASKQGLRIQTEDGSDFAAPSLEDIL
jgi:hypothetical protein